MFLRVSALPRTAHSGAGGTVARAANSTGSIICPMKPSASTTTGLRYRSARSKAQVVRSAISCTESGATTLDDLVVIALLGRDVAQAGPAAHDIGDHAGQFRACQVTEAFLHQADAWTDRKSTRLNSSHLGISYAVFCLKKK